MAETTGFVLREGTEADLPALEWEGEYRRYRSVYRESLEDAKRGARLLLVAEVERQVVGQIFIHFSSPWAVPDSEGRAGYLYAFRVRPAHRGRGIGRALLNEAEAALVRAGVRNSVIAVSHANPKARGLYERCGYRWIAADPGRWSYLDEHGQTRRVSEPADILAKRLGPGSG